ncbi:MAG: ribulose-phosphate 3-epimerase [Anaerolineales bacterium]
MKIAPSILAADFTQLGHDIRAATDAGADQLHVDVMDGRFVPNISFGTPILAAARAATPLPLDVHLMIVEPERHLAAFAEAGADMLTIHAETCPNLHRNLQEIKALGLRAGVALNPHTPALMVSEVLHLADILLVMTVNPGQGGQSFLPETLPKIRTLRRMATEAGHALDIAVDGGINAEVAGPCLEAGANVLVVGSSVFKAPQGIPASINALRNLRSS